MVDSVRLDVKVREATGTAEGRRHRRAGNVPVILYGLGHDNRMFTVTEHAITRLIDQGGHIAELSLDGDTQVALVKDVQWDGLGQRIVHADFQRIDRDKVVHVFVPVRFIGVAPTISGSVVDKIRDDIQVEVLPLEIPKEFVVNISQLDVGDTVHISELEMPEGCSLFNHNPEDVVITHHMKAHQQDEEEGEGDGEVSLEPERIGEKKEDGDE